MDSNAEDWLKALGAAKDTLQGFYDAHDGDLTMQDRLTSCRGMLESLEGFIDALKADQENWVVSGDRGRRRRWTPTGEARRWSTRSSSSRWTSRPTPRSSSAPPRRCC